MVYSVRAVLSPDCAVVLLLELAIVVMPHRNQPAASATVVSPHLAGLAAGASDWGRPVAAPPLFDISGPDRQTDPLIAWSKCEESDKTRNILALQRLMSLAAQNLWAAGEAAPGALRWTLRRCGRCLQAL